MLINFLNIYMSTIWWLFVVLQRQRAVWRIIIIKIKNTSSSSSSMWYTSAVWSHQSVTGWIEQTIEQTDYRVLCCMSHNSIHTIVYVCGSGPHINTLVHSMHTLMRPARASLSQAQAQAERHRHRQGCRIPSVVYTRSQSVGIIILNYTPQLYSIAYAYIHNAIPQKCSTMPRRTYR